MNPGFTCESVARAELGEPVKRRGAELYYHAPWRADRNPSLQINTEKNTWADFPMGFCGTAWELAARLFHLDPKDKPAMMATLTERGLLDGRNGKRIVTVYDYCDENGALLYQTVRYFPKDFRQRRPNGKGGWEWNLDVKLVPYRLPEWKDRETIFICEGEKDANALWEIGIPATTCPMGAGKWRADYNQYFSGKQVVILPDNDQAGASHGRAVARDLFPVAKAVKILPLPDLPHQGDVSDWIAAGGTCEKLLELIKATPVLTPAEVAEWGERRKEQGSVPASGLLPKVKLNLLKGYDPEDVGNAQRLVAMFGDRLRYCHAFGKWLVWDGRRWKVDDVDRARMLAHEMMTAFAMQALKAHADEKVIKFAASCRKTARITNCLREAQPLVPITPAQLDTHPFLLNFLNGTLDLRTGELTPHNREHFISKLIYREYNSQARCPLFLGFLNQIMGCHPGASLGELERADQLVDYLQRALGYSMTGETIEKVVFFLYGAGDNGKTTLLSTFLHLLQEYAVLLQVDTLMVRQESNNTQADLADLRGARFVMTSETEEGQRLAEGKLKRITQGMGKIKAVRKYENPVEFPESHKLWIDANHLPSVRGTDNAIWNRLVPLPFNVTIPKEGQDKQLRAKLLTEAEGILAWTAQGARRWYADGLGKPPDVEEANMNWRAESDQLGRFIDDCCIVREEAWVQARPLYSAYKKWAEDGGEWAESEKKFAQRMKERGVGKKHKNIGTLYEGLELRVTGDGA